MDLPNYLPAWDADRWTICPASARRPRGGWPTREHSDLAKECQAIVAAARALVRVEVSAAEELVDRVAPGGWVMTADLVHHAHLFAAAVISYGSRSGHFWDIENAATLQDWGGVGGISGFAALDERGLLHVFRLDYGYQVVELEGETGDLQLALLGLVMSERMDHDVSAGVHMHVYQPRPYHRLGPWRDRHCTADEMTNMRNWLGHRAAAAHDDVSKAQVNRRCKGCNHSANCDALRRQAYTDMDLLAGDMIGERSTPENLARELAHAEVHRTLAEERLIALRREARARALAGEWIRGYGIEPGLGDREIRDPAVAELVTGVRATKVVPRTPAEMERDGADPDVLAQFTYRPSTGPRLVKVTEANAKRSFNR